MLTLVIDNRNIPTKQDYLKAMFIQVAYEANITLEEAKQITMEILSENNKIIEEDTQ